MAKQKVYVQVSFVSEIEIDTELMDVEEFIKKYYDMLGVCPQIDEKPASIQYMVEDSEWVEIHDI